MTQDNPNPSYPSYDSNYNFLLAMNRHRMEGDYLNFKDLDQKISLIFHKLNGLNINQKNQWKEIQESKICHLAKSLLNDDQRSTYQKNREMNKQKIKALKQHLRILVIVCYRQKMAYNSDTMMQIIKKLYFRQYKEDIFLQFVKVGYSTHQFQVVTGHDDSSFFSFCCCVDENSYS